MKTDVHIECVNRMKRVAILTNGAIVPIVDFYDGEGNDCDPGEAVGFVCGDKINKFRADVFKNYETLSTQ